MRLASGIDLVDLDRFERALQRQGERFLLRIYTPKELARYRNQTVSLAARFAAKEAVAKTLGTGIGIIRWQDVEVLSDGQNAPVLTLYAAARRRAEKLGLQNWSISLSHTHQHAIALVVALGDG